MKRGTIACPHGEAPTPASPWRNCSRLSDAASKKMMLDIAKDYERLAEKAEQSAKKKES
jgi:hypothetical protein